MLCSPVLVSLANSKLLDFFQASNSMTLCINRMLYVTCYTHVLLTLGACAVGIVTIIVDTSHRHLRNPSHVAPGELYR